MLSIHTGIPFKSTSLLLYSHFRIQDSTVTLSILLLILAVSFDLLSPIDSKHRSFSLKRLPLSALRPLGREHVRWVALECKQSLLKPGSKGYRKQKNMRHSWQIWFEIRRLFITLHNRSSLVSFQVSQHKSETHAASFSAQVLECTCCSKSSVHEENVSLSDWKRRSVPSGRCRKIWQQNETTKWRLDKIGIRLEDYRTSDQDIVEPSFSRRNLANVGRPSDVQNKRHLYRHQTTSIQSVQSQDVASWSCWEMFIEDQKKHAKCKLAKHRQWTNGQMDKHYLTKHFAKVDLFVVHLSCCVLCMSDLTSINLSRTPTLPGLSLS